MTNSNSTQTAAPGGNRVYQYFDRVCSKIENTEFNATVYISVVMLVGFCRVIFEVLFQGEVALDMDDLCNWPALYLVLVPVFVVWMSPLLKMPREKLFNIVLVGTLFGVLPPVYDIFLTGWWKATYAYHLQTPWHFYAPPALPLGEAATVWSTIVFTTAYIAFRSKSIIKTLAGIFLSWLSLWVLSQSYLYALYLFKLMRFSDEHMMGDRPLTFLYILISLFAYILFNYQRFKYSFKRILHCLPWFFLTLIGGKLVGNVASITVLLGFVVSLFFMMVMIQNDYYDKESDKINKRESRINQQDVDFFHYLMLWLAIFFYFVTGT